MMLNMNEQASKIRQNITQFEHDLTLKRKKEREKKKKKKKKKKKQRY